MKRYFLASHRLELGRVPRCGIGIDQDRAGYDMGCAVGDFDNDGFDDLVVTYWSGVVLYHNQADGSQVGRRFVDITETAGLHDPHWATSCGWGDTDGDGDLDLYVCNYNEIDLSDYPLCVHEDILISCAPWWFPTVSHRLYQNQGDGTFSDVTAASGVADASPAPGLGVVLVDLDQDGQLDIYVANDARPAYLFPQSGWRPIRGKGFV